jgi:hypothetical protein
MESYLTKNDSGLSPGNYWIPTRFQEIPLS